ncbi:unnamed protein product [Heterobilharzia americana]|nr:unnamed protein product [Heterobilharzia americana]
MMNSSLSIHVSNNDNNNDSMNPCRPPPPAYDVSAYSTNDTTIIGDTKMMINNNDATFPRHRFQSKQYRKRKQQPQQNSTRKVSQTLLGNKFINKNSNHIDNGHNYHYYY